MLILFLFISISAFSQVCSTYDINDHKLFRNVDLSGAEHLISQYDFDNTNYGYKDIVRFISSYRGHLSPKHIERAYWCAIRWKLNPLMVLAKMEMENNLITGFNITNVTEYTNRLNWAMGYGVYIREKDGSKPFLGYDV